MNKLKYYWVYVPYLDAPERQNDTALHTGYVKVYPKHDVDNAIAELKETLKIKDDLLTKNKVELASLKIQIDSLQRENQVLNQYKLAAHSSYGIGEKFKEEHK